MIQSISVVIPTFNLGRFVGEAIESALSQTHKPAEIIVIDDGSTDETASIVNGIEGVCYVKQQNGGVCIARNHGVRIGSGDYIAFLDADDVWEPKKLELQLKIFLADQGIGLVHCGMREFDSTTRRTIDLRTEGLDGWIADELLLWERPAINVSGSSIMVTREAFDRVGGFDPEIKVGEDWDFCYRVARSYKVGFVPEPLVNYRSHPASAHRNISEMERGMGLFYKKAFAADTEAMPLRRRAYGNFHRVMAGSYYNAGDYFKFAEHTLKSLLHRPGGIRYFLEFSARSRSRDKDRH